jgi:hypothetical protein
MVDLRPYRGKWGYHRAQATSQPSSEAQKTKALQDVKRKGSGNVD